MNHEPSYESRIVSLFISRPDSKDDRPSNLQLFAAFKRASFNCGRKNLTPLPASSVPTAFVGGLSSLMNAVTNRHELSTALAAMVFAFRQANDGDPDRPIPLCGAIIIEAAVVSGLTGVGGGVFLATHTHRTAPGVSETNSGAKSSGRCILQHDRNYAQSQTCWPKEGGVQLASGLGRASRSGRMRGGIAGPEPRRIFMFIRSLLFIAAIVTSLATQAAAEDKSIVVASTTSTQDSGLFGYLLPIFKEKTGIDVKVVAEGTGQALDTARRGDADVVFVHAKSSEEKFLSEGFGVKRYPVMYNDFVLIGPQRDPAGVKGKDIVTALQTIKVKSAPFISRGDRSGTNIAEIELWKDAGIDIAKDKGPWYKEVGQGMGAALNTASALNAYVLSDRGTWLAFKNRGDLAILVEGDKRLRNQYGVMLVNPAKHASVPDGRKPKCNHTSRALVRAPGVGRWWGAGS